MTSKKSKKCIARRIDNTLAIGAGIAILVMGLHLHWYDYYICLMMFAVIVPVMFWRLPLYCLFWFFYKKERSYWANIISQYTITEEE